MKRRRRVGRPRGKRYDVSLKFMVNEDWLKLIDEASIQNSMGRSEFMRDVCEKAAKRILRQASSDVRKARK